MWKTTSKNRRNGAKMALTCSCCRALTKAFFSLLVCSAFRAFFWLDVMHCSQRIRPLFSCFQWGVKSVLHWAQKKGSTRASVPLSLPAKIILLQPVMSWIPSDILLSPSVVFIFTFQTLCNRNDWKLTLTIEHALHHFLQAHHVDKLAVGGRGQEVEQWGRGFGWRYLQQCFLQLLPQGELGCCLAAGLVCHGAHPSTCWAGHGGRADSWGSTESTCHSTGSCCCRSLHVGQVHVHGTGAWALWWSHLLAGLYRQF